MAKKDFKLENPALAFISNAEVETPTSNTNISNNAEVENKPAFNSTIKAPAGYKVNPDLFIETKNKRVQLILQPSLVCAVKALAEQRNTSMNELFNEAMQIYLMQQIENETEGE